MYINSRKDLKRFLDFELGIIKKQSGFWSIHFPLDLYEERIKYRLIKYLRKAEYHNNCKHYIRGFFSKYRLYKYEVKNRIFLPMNAIDMGLNIAHIGPIYINDNARIGKNFKVYPGTVVGNNEFKDHVLCPKLGDNVYLAMGAKVFGNVEIADHCIIAANSVVTKSFKNKNMVIAGVPAKEIMKHNYY